MGQEEKDKKIGFKAKEAWLEMGETEKEEVFKFSKEYARFLSANKTEREFATASVELLEQEGFKNLNTVDSLTSGDKVYSVNRKKEVIAFIVGKKSLTDGLYIVGSHIDSPRIDLKPDPLFEKKGMVFLDSHYYGGIKKYQWVTIPLAIHGVLVKEDGQTIEISIGEEEDDPVFYISDLLIHLSDKQLKKKMSEAITGEQLNIMIGSIPLKDKDVKKEKVKAAILKLLEEKYEILAEDFISADLEVVPALKARDVGFDRGLLAGYGHDDRVCSYAALRALLDMNQPEKTAMVLLMDREEIGSMGSTGMQSWFFENTVAQAINLYYQEYNDLLLRKVLRNTRAISGDVSAAFDPGFREVFSETNSAYLGKGIVLTKYTGSRGKAGASEATAEFMGKIRRLFNKNGILWQVGGLGKVDEGGGGTIAQFLANYSMDVVDIGPALLSMHSPYEIVSKVDLYHAYLGYLVFLEQNIDN